MDNKQILRDFVNECGGAAEAARRLGYGSVYIYQMLNGSSRVSAEAIHRIQTGEKSEKRRNTTLRPNTRDTFDVNADLSAMDKVDLSTFIAEAERQIVENENTIATAIARAERMIEKARKQIPLLKDAGRRAVAAQAKLNMKKFSGGTSIDRKSPVILNDLQRRFVAASDEPTSVLADRFGVSKSQIKRVRKSA